MIGPRVGIRVGEKTGVAIGVANDPLGGGTFTDLHIEFLGQSNARGQAATTTADTGLNVTTAFPAVNTDWHLGVSNANPIVYDFDHRAQALQPYQNNSSSPGYGFEIAMGRYLVGTNAATAPYIGKISVNGMDIETMIPGAGTPATPKEFWLQIVDYLDARVAETSRPIDYVVWSQWEADATSDAKANAYSGNLDTLFTALRARYGNFKIIMMRASPSATGAGVLASSRAIIQSTQDAWCAIGGNNAILINTDAYPLISNIHYDQDSVAILGNIAAERIASSFTPGRNTNRSSGSAPWIQNNDMPVVSSTGAGALTPWLPLHKVGDLIVVVVQTSTVNVNPTLTTANGFVQLGSTSPGNNGATFNLTSVYTKVAAVGTTENGTQDPAPVITPGAGTTMATAIAFTIRNTSGSDATPTIAGGIANPGTIPSITTASANDLVVQIAGGHSGSQTQSLNAATNGTLANYSLRRNTRRVVSANGEIIGFAAGTLAAAGASGTGSFTWATAPIWSAITLAFKP